MPDPRGRRPARRGDAAHARGRGQGRPGAGTVAAVVAGIALLGIVVFFAMRGKKEQPPPAPPQPPPAQSAPDPQALLRDEARIWFAQTFLDDMSRERPLPGKRIDELLDEARKRGYDKIPGFDFEAQRKKVYERLLRREPDHPEANRAFGRVPLVDYPDFFAVFQKLTDAKALPPELKTLRGDYEDRVKFAPRRTAPAVEPAEFRRVTALLDQYQQLEQKLSTDPTYRAIYEALERVKIDPILGQYEFVHVEVGPFVLFYGSRELKAGKADVAQKLKARLESFRRLIDDLIAFHRERWVQPLGLRGFAPGEVFCVWVFSDKASWEHYGRQTETPLLPGTKGYFSPRDHWAFIYDDPKESFAVEVAVAHELTHLLHWHYSKDPESDFKNHFDHVEAVWFTEGWAEYVGWVKRQGDGYAFAQDSPIRMEVYQAFKKLELPLYPLQEFVKRTDYFDWFKEVCNTWLPKKIRVPEDAVARAAIEEAYFGMLYSQAWLFMKFLYDGQNGKYRQKILDFTKATIHGYLDYRGERGYARPYEVFGQIFELKTKADWDRFQAEFDKFLETKLYEIPPPR